MLHCFQHESGLKSTSAGKDGMFCSQACSFSGFLKSAPLHWRAVQPRWQVSYRTHILCSFLSRKVSSTRAEARGCVSYVTKIFSQSWGHWFVVTHSESAYTEMHTAMSTASVDDTDQNQLGNISVWHFYIYFHILIWMFTIKTGMHLGSPDREQESQTQDKVSLNVGSMKWG